LFGLFEKQQMQKQQNKNKKLKRNNKDRVPLAEFLQSTKIKNLVRSRVYEFEDTTPESLMRLIDDRKDKNKERPSD